jgi:ribosomal protein L11 methyltransferase
VHQYVQKGDIVIDYGCGSGVLGIMALKRGASKIIAVDIDEDTLQAAKVNFKLNHMLDQVDLCHSAEVYVGNDRFPSADITVANILPVR